MQRTEPCRINFPVILKITLAVLALELLVFNFRHWESMGNREIKSYQITLGEGLVMQDDGSYLTGPGEKTIEFSNINRELKTLYLDVDVLENQESVNRAATLYQHARDDSNELEYWIPDRDIWHSQEKSRYLTYHFYGNCKSLKLTLALDDGVNFRLGYLLNPRIPMFFSLARVLALWCIGVFFYAFRPASRVYRVRYLECGRWKKVLVPGFLALHILGAGVLVHINPYFQDDRTEWSCQYQKLAEAFANGQVSLLQEPDQALIDMENPYDRAYRQKVMDETGQGFLWDHAYYEGKYYVYFGVVPEVLLYFPYYLLTHRQLHNRDAIFVMAAVFLIALMGVIHRILKRWFPKTSVGAWYLLSETTVLSCGLVYMCRRPDIYTVPILSALALGLLGFWCFLCANKEGGGLSAKLVAAGSLCTALVAGCRPQLFLIAAFSVILLRNYMFSYRYLKSREGRTCAFSFLLPMAAVALALMYYNYIRFGSIFNFGANYNLTMNDMRNRGLVADRIGLGIWAYFFAPVQLKLTFPFLAANSFDTNYLGTTIFESTYGGVFAISLFAWLCPALVIFRKHVEQRHKPLLFMAYAGMISAAVIAVLDAQVAGILLRYFGDFLFFIVFAAFLAWLLLFEKAKGSALEKPMLVFLLVCLAVAALYQGLQFFVDTGESLMDYRKDLFSTVKYQVMFWL